MSPRDREEIGFLDAIFGLLFEPGGTVTALLNYERPPYAFTIFLSLIATVYTPIVAQIYKYGSSVFNGSALLSLSIIIVFTILIFVLVEGLFLQLLGIPIGLRGLWASVAYCITPFILAIWLVYLFNYLAMGRLTLVTLFLTGYSAVDDRFLRIVPLAMLVAQLNVLVVYYHCMRFMGQMEAISAVLVTFFSLIPFYVALLISISIGEIARPGTIGLFEKILIAPISLTNFTGG